MEMVYVLLSVLQIASNKPATFIATNPSITILQRDCQTRLAVCTFEPHTHNTYNQRGCNVGFISFLLFRVFSTNYLNVLFILNIIDYFFISIFTWRRYIGTHTSHKESKDAGSLSNLPSRASNASSSIEDERWLAYKSYSQMPSERNGNVGREDWKAPSLTYVGVHHPPRSSSRSYQPPATPFRRRTPNRAMHPPSPRTLFVPFSPHTQPRYTMQSIDNTTRESRVLWMPRPEDQTANLNRCLFFITPLISYATPVLFRI